MIDYLRNPPRRKSALPPLGWSLFLVFIATVLVGYVAFDFCIIFSERCQDDLLAYYQFTHNLLLYFGLTHA